jgi:mannose-6-phosphate isomerase-like protein (cupin superfamily)
MTNTDESKELFPYRIPTCAAIEDPPPKGQATSSTGTTASVRTLVNPSMATTAHLHVQYLTLPPQFEAPPRPATAVEFYYVVAGAGVLSQQGIPVRQTLTAGDCCVVDAGHMRWFKNTSLSQALILLRATDGPCGDDRIRKDPNYRSTSSGTLEASAAVLTNGLRVLQSTASDFYHSTNSNSNSNNSNNSNNNKHNKHNNNNNKHNNKSITVQDKEKCPPARKKTALVADKRRSSTGQQPQEALAQ